jgi:riboflavin kinase/FMN adenylyltransferase
MRVFRSSLEAQGQLRAPAVAIGNFDGVHLGHQALFARARELAAGCSGEAVALTFDPHPARFFNPELAPPLIQTPSQKLEAIDACGIDAVVIKHFNADFAALTAQEFVRRILVERLHVRHVVVGQGFVFGARRAGSFETLVELGRAHGFQAHAVETVRVASIVVSSTKLREFLLLGRVGGASMLLGRDYIVEGLVVPGKARGRSIGIPTANVAAENEIIPRKGVYAGWARLHDGGVRAAVTNIGTNPTFEKADVMSLEVHVLDWSGDLYGTRVGAVFTQRLRDEKRFDSVDQLVAAIQHDIRDARMLLRAPAIAIRRSA